MEYPTAERLPDKRDFVHPRCRNLDLSETCFVYLQISNTSVGYEIFVESANSCEFLARPS